MFNDHVRAYGRLGASLIAVPRATGLSTDIWHAAAKMAAMVSGTYVLVTTSADRPLCVFELDAALVQQRDCVENLLWYALGIPVVTFVSILRAAGECHICKQRYVGRFTSFSGCC
jgi:predicted amidohydrolase